MFVHPLKRRWRGCGERAPLVRALSVGTETGEVTMENGVRCLQKLKTELSHDLAIPLLGIYPPKSKIRIQKDTRTPVLTAALPIIAKIWRPPKCPSIGGWTWKKWSTSGGTLPSHKTILPFVTTWMDREGVMLSERSQTEKDEYHTIPLRCGI